MNGFAYKYGVNKSWRLPRRIEGVKLRDFTSAIILQTVSP
jgi:hypothetical protein